MHGDALENNYGVRPRNLKKCMNFTSFIESFVIVVG